MKTAASSSKASLGSLRSWSTREIVVGAVLAVAVGVIFWAWGLLWATAFAAIPFPASYLLVGVWMIGGVLVPYVVRRPGAALVGELVAAFVSMLLVTQWGFAVMLSGVVQGLGAELVFSSTRWRKYSLPVLMAAGAVAGVFSILLDSYYAGYWESYSTNSILLGIVFVAISGAVAGFLSKVIADLLAGTGVLSGLAIGKAGIRRVG